MEKLLDLIRNHSENLFEQIRTFRHYLHANPELSFQEKQTSLFIAKTLRGNNIPVFETIGGTGIIGIIEGQPNGKTIGIRAELDALPIIENTSLDFSSKNSGAMHACGHDIHMASLLGTAIIINKLKNNLKGRILLVFESGEEQIPGGAKQIIDSNIFQQNIPDIMLTFHVLPELALGKAGFREGQYMASGDEVYITVKGKGGHAALPKTTVNPIVIASKLILNLKEFIDNETPQQIPSILSFGKIQANGATNIIPNEVFIEGTFRTMDEDWRRKVHHFIEEISKKTCIELGGNCEIEIRKGYPSIYNNPEITRKSKRLAEHYLDPSNVIDLDKRMTTDDFAYFSQVIPSVFFRMGVGFENNRNYQLHSSTFIANEEVLKYSSGLMAWISFNLSNKLD
ncbi:MAG: amidohydrolase [Bacteroidales bacterium]|nr:amidohydrolase [Bacteroidales bacterium]